MKTIKSLFYSSLLILSSSLTYGQSWDWGVAGSGSLKTNDYGSPVATDKSGNAFITGQYSTSVTFGSITLTGNGDNAYLTKYNPAGNALWAVEPYDSGNSSSYGESVTLDKMGNIYVTGMFEGTVIFGTTTLRTNYTYNNEAVFLVKYSSTGNVLWAKQSIPHNIYSYYNVGTSVATDNMDNAYITGTISDTITFGGYTLINPYYEASVFLTKYDSAGNVMWAKQSIAPSSSCRGNGASVATDNLGNAYICGSFSTALFFGSYRLISLNNTSEFLVKYSPAGNVLWAKQNINTNSISSSAGASSVITDKADNIYITGDFDDSINFGGHILYSYSTNSTFLTKYDSNGNTLWAKQSSEGLIGLSLSSDNTNHIYLSCSNAINDTLFRFGSLSFHTIAWANSYSFLLKFDTAGITVCGSMLENLGAPNYYTSSGIAADPSGNYVYMAGTFFNDTILCGPDTLVAGNGDGTVFLGRWLNCAADAGVNLIPSPTSSVSLFPNPNNGIFTVALGHAVPMAIGIVSASQPIVEVYNMLGEQVLTETLRSTQGDNTIDLSGKPNGVYLYRVITQDGQLVGEGKFIIAK